MVGPCYSSPLLVKIGVVRQVVEWNHRVLAGIESASGRLLWEYPFPHETHNQNMPTPVFHKGRVLLGGENRGVHSIEPLYKAGKWTVKKRWSQKKVALDMASAIVNGDLLYGLSHYDKGRFFCLDMETGEIRWMGPPRTGQNVMFLAIPGYVLALVSHGELHILTASGEGFKKVASYEVADSQTWAPPVLLKGSILVKDHETLTRWDFPAAGSE